MNKIARFFLVTTAVVVGNFYAGAWRADADFIQTNLVSDIPGLAALTDPILQNPWGISHNATSPFWISDQRTNVATLYAVAPNLMKVVPAGTDGNIVIPQRQPDLKVRRARSPTRTPRPSRLRTAGMASPLALSLPISTAPYRPGTAAKQPLSK
jgi:hypothetical protein